MSVKSLGQHLKKDIRAERICTGRRSVILPAESRKTYVGSRGIGGSDLLTGFYGKEGKV